MVSSCWFEISYSINKLIDTLVKPELRCHSLFSCPLGVGDEKCLASGGTCKNRYSCSQGVSKIETGKCPGNRDNICCVPKCVESGGECKHRATCDLSNSKIETGKCPGDRNNICCIPKEPDSGRHILHNILSWAF